MNCDYIDFLWLSVSCVFNVTGCCGWLTMLTVWVYLTSVRIGVEAVIWFLISYTTGLLALASTLTTFGAATSMGIKSFRTISPWLIGVVVDVDDPLSGTCWLTTNDGWLLDDDEVGMVVCCVAVVSVFVGLLCFMGMMSFRTTYDVEVWAPLFVMEIYPVLGIGSTCGRSWTSTVGCWVEDESWRTFLA